MADPTKEEVAEAEEAVLFPDAHTEPYEFAGQTFKLRALPIKRSREVAAVLKPFQKAMSDISVASQSQGKKQEVELPDFDSTAVNALLQTASIITEFYAARNDDNKRLSPESLEDLASLDEIMSFIRAQLEVNGKSDFLLAPLKLIMKLADAVGNADEEIDRAMSKVTQDS